MNNTNNSNLKNITNSTYNSINGRYVMGGTTEVSDKLEIWDKGILPSDPSDIVYYVEQAYVNKPHLLGYVFYGDIGLWWVICQYNGIIDPINEIIQGKMLLIPLKDRIKHITNNSTIVGGIPSTRVPGA